MYKEEVLPHYEIVQGSDATVEQNLYVVPNLLLGLVRVYWD